MSNCRSCGAKFQFTDMLKGLNLANLKCKGCDARIRSSYMAYVTSLVIFIFLTIAILYSPMSRESNGELMTLGLVIFVALLVEYAHFKLVETGKVKSNLDVSDVSA